MTLDELSDREEIRNINGTWADAVVMHGEKRSFLTSLRIAIGAFFLAFLCSESTASPAIAANVGVGAQYDTTHIYVQPADFDPFIVSFVATFGGTTSTKVVLTVTPTPSSTISQAALTPAGSISVFGFTTPIPYPFGAERTGYLVTDLDAAVAAAQAAGASVIVQPFNDPIGRDVVVQWPGGINMQLYWHTSAPHYPALATIPENRIYVSTDRADAFVSAFTSFAHGTVVSDERSAPGVEIGQPSLTYRRIRIESTFGHMNVAVTDGKLPYPYGREMTGYEVANLAQTLAKASAAGATIIVSPFQTTGRTSAMVQFPGGYIAEIHARSTP